MSKKTQKLSIRLLREGLVIEDAVRGGSELVDWPKIEGAKIVLETIGGGAPKWAGFLELSGEEKSKLINLTAIGVVFLGASDRWFAVSFGLGHVKLDPAFFEQDFGLRIVLNTVDPVQLKSADFRTPDENTVSRRSQTSRGSDQTAFSIDIERDIVRGIAGRPKNLNFASRVSGSDALSMDRKASVLDLPTICAEALAAYNKDDYKENFAWIDQIRHVRDAELIQKLDAKVAEALTSALAGVVPDTLHLAFPVIYDPEHANCIRYKGFRSAQIFHDLDITGYLIALKERGKTDFGIEDLIQHTVHEVDEEGTDCGDKWRVRDCIVFDIEMEGKHYVLSGGRWYLVDPMLAQDVTQFFQSVEQVELPPGESGENEEKYNNRIAISGHDLLCLDRKMLRPTGAASFIEACDFISKSREMIHIKDKTSSSRLSHLFSQGTVSARVLKLDGVFRDALRGQIIAQQALFRLVGFDDVIPSARDEVKPSEFKVIYGVITSSGSPRLPFFSLVTFRQAARELQALGYKFAFAWIKKPTEAATEKVKRKKEDRTADDGE